jgi:MFS family permease
VALPRIEPLPRPRYTLVDLAKQVSERSFVVPTLVLAASTAALGASVGFLPALAAHHGAGTVAAVTTAAVLALASTVAQPFAGRLRDRDQVTDRIGMSVGLVAVAVGITVAALVPSLVMLLLAAVLIGTGVGAVTPLAFAHLAGATPAERMGRTMGTAELGRELGDAAGPLVVGIVAATATLPLGLGALSLLVFGASIVSYRAFSASTANEPPVRRPGA